MDLQQTVNKKHARVIETAKGPLELCKNCIRSCGYLDNSNREKNG